MKRKRNVIMGVVGLALLAALVLAASTLVVSGATSETRPRENTHSPGSTSVQ